LLFSRLFRFFADISKADVRFRLLFTTICKRDVVGCAKSLREASVEAGVTVTGDFAHAARFPMPISAYSRLTHRSFHRYVKNSLLPPGAAMWADQTPFWRVTDPSSRRRAQNHP
jgi:hypothetical protein